MACGITALNSNSVCGTDNGGLVRSWMCKSSDITAATFVSGELTALTMASTGLWKKMEYDQDDTAYFNQAGARTNGRYSNTQTSFLKFKGMTAAYVAAANAVKDCCAVVVIHVFANGSRFVQGIEADAGATGGFKLTRVETRVTPSALSDTGANQSRLEYLIEGQSDVIAPSTTLTDAALAAL